jgi:UPF0755 protein
VDPNDRFRGPAADDHDSGEDYDSGEDAGPGGTYDPGDIDDRGGGGPGRAGRRRRATLPKLLVLLVVVAAVLGAGIYAVGSLFPRIGDSAKPKDYAGAGTTEVDVRVAPGDGISTIAATLYRAGVVASKKAFVRAATLNPDAQDIQPGAYHLRRAMSAATALAVLLNPKNDYLRFTIAEGETVQAVLHDLSGRTNVPVAAYEEIVRHPAGKLVLPSFANGLVEGYLFPSTYELEPTASPAQTLQMFINTFNDQAAGLDLPSGAAKLGVTPAQIVIIASILEKEVKNPPEYPMAARVIYNRLRDPAHFPTLGMDSTTRYAEDNYEGPLTRSQLGSNNPYNTRKISGLPPGAIANPGSLALRSALNPTAGAWNYFVSLPNGETKFAVTADEFNKLLAQYHAEGGTLGG